MQGDMTVGSVYDWLDSWAHFDSAEEWDNSGLLAGSMDMPVKGVLVSLNITPSVIRQATKLGAELIISHHPLIFNPITRLNSDEPPYQLARYGMAAISAHTNLDKAQGGVNDNFASCLLLDDIHTADDGICRIGTLKDQLMPNEFAEHIRRRLGIPKGGILWTDGRRPIRTVTVCGGAGGDYINTAPETDAFVTGELHYHEWPINPVRTIIAAGHYHTEIIIVRNLVNKLAGAFPTLKVYAADESCPYEFL
ncbi:MAG: Nif3-like dinuclear metal center hexameric protein [Oscillospiraceae bacterium]|nr:Nif3-like dinuclear metal center hexameric protein [Oscillospiraceae bacterium]MDD3833332.1 Nif3-like dinuclear metal center hexameric protein [Oscillospiraceae bacterium]MDD4546108.1 Nif3-like dinuclear metal center hexameric protein [Oscillospiraceae bacterium]